MPPVASLHNHRANANTVRLGHVSLHFSYSALIGFSAPGIGAVRDQQWVKHSRTTTRHAFESFALSAAPAVPTESFEALVQTALGFAYTFEDTCAAAMVKAWEDCHTRAVA